MAKKPEAQTSLAQQELDKAEKQLNAFEDQVKELTMDRMNAAPKQEVEPQTKIAQKDLDKHNDLYLKPHRSVACRDKFNENYREEYNFAKEYVHFIAENHEVKGETIDMWTRPFAGMSAEWWKIPTNKPIWAPRYVAEQLKRSNYHRLIMDENRQAGSDGMGQYFGTMAADTTIQRLDAIPVSSRKSLFMGRS